MNGNPLSFAIFANLESDIGFVSPEGAEELELAGVDEAFFTRVSFGERQPLQARGISLPVISFPTTTWVYPGVLEVVTDFFTLDESMTFYRD